MAQNKDYSIRLVEKDDTAEILDLLKRTFYIDEPMNEAIGLCAEGVDNCPELDEYCTEDIVSGYSLKAVDQQGKIVSVLLCGERAFKTFEDEKELASLTENCKHPKFRKILHVIAQREIGAKLWLRYPDDNVLVDVSVAATDPNWRRKGIMVALMEELQKLLKKRGIRLLRMDASSAYSAKTAERHGFTCVYSAKYTDIKLDGETLIVPRPPHTEDKVFIKEL